MVCQLETLESRMTKHDYEFQLPSQVESMTWEAFKFVVDISFLWIPKTHIIFKRSNLNKKSCNVLDVDRYFMPIFVTYYMSLMSDFSFGSFSESPGLAILL